MFARRLGSALIWNLLLIAVVFLPAFLLASLVEVRFRGASPLEGGAGYHAGAALVIYLTMILPLAVGSLVHTISTVFVGGRIRVWRGQFLVALVLAPLVPAVVLVLGLPGSTVLSTLFVSASIATAAYGLCSGARFVRGTSAADGRGARTIGGEGAT